MNILEILYILEHVSWILAAIAVTYLLLFSLASLKKEKTTYPPASKLHKFMILFPAYQEDRIIVSSIESFLQQDYPQEQYHIVVISDHMQETTNQQLSRMPITLLKANYDNSSKAKALKLAMNHFDREAFDAVVILDADNIVEPHFLSDINNAIAAGTQAIQAHRIAKNRNTNTAVLDGLSEEINNSIFRSGHVRLGFSSALSGSGMAFNYQWFHANVKHLMTSGEDKELERMLLQQKIFIDFLDNTYVYDEKVQAQKGFYHQRRRWLASQFTQCKGIFKELPRALFSGNMDYFNKLIQWLFPPRLILLGGIIIMGSTLLIIERSLAIKWWGLFLIMSLSLCLAIPKQMFDKPTRQSLIQLPVLFILMVINLFRIKGMDKKFVNTEKNGSSTL